VLVLVLGAPNACLVSSLLQNLQSGTVLYIGTMLYNMQL